MLMLITYDVETASSGGARRLRRISKICLDYGQRVQYSVFECEVDPGQWESLRAKLIKEFDEQKDSLRFYHLGKNWKRKVEHLGAKPAIDFQGPLVF